jgi:hypothetical protein
MSIYHSPEIVQLLMAERLREAERSRRGSRPHGPQVPSQLRRLFVGAQTPAPCAC